MKNLAHNKYHILRLLVGLSFLLVLVIGLPSQSLAQSVPEAADSACLEVWQAVINVSEDGAGTQDLVFGQGIYASSGNDVCDQLAPPPPPTGGFDARLTVSSPANDFLTDYRSSAGATTSWRIKIQPSSAGGYPFTFTWDIASLPGGGSLFLRDTFGGVVVNINMRNESSYILTNDGINQLDIVYTIDRCLLTAIDSGDWNNPSTWDDNCLPTDSPDDSLYVDVLIPDGHVVDFNLGTDTIGNLTVGGGGGGGVLQFPGAGTLMIAGDLDVLMDGLLDLGALGNLELAGVLTNEGRLSQVKTVGATESTNAIVSFFDIGGYSGLTIDSTTTPLGSTRVTIRGGQQCDSTDSAVHRSFFIEPTSSTSAAGLTFSFASNELNGSTCNEIQAWRALGSTSTDWVEAGALGARSCGASPYTVGYTGVTLLASENIFCLRSSSQPTVINLSQLTTSSSSIGIDDIVIIAITTSVLSAVLLVLMIRQRKQHPGKLQE